MAWSTAWTNPWAIPDMSAGKIANNKMITTATLNFIGAPDPYEADRARLAGSMRVALNATPDRSPSAHGYAVRPVTRTAVPWGDALGLSGELDAQYLCTAAGEGDELDGEHRLSGLIQLGGFGVVIEHRFGWCCRQEGDGTCVDGQSHAGSPLS